MSLVFMLVIGTLGLLAVCVVVGLTEGLLRQVGSLFVVVGRPLSWPIGVQEENGDRHWAVELLRPRRRRASPTIQPTEEPVATEPVEGRTQPR